MASHRAGVLAMNTRSVWKSGSLLAALVIGLLAVPEAYAQKGHGGHAGGGHAPHVSAPRQAYRAPSMPRAAAPRTPTTTRGHKRWLATHRSALITHRRTPTPRRPALATLRPAPTTRRPVPTTRKPTLITRRPVSITPRFAPIAPRRSRRGRPCWGPAIRPRPLASTRRTPWPARPPRTPTPTARGRRPLVPGLQLRSRLPEPLLWQWLWLRPISGRQPGDRLATTVRTLESRADRS